MKERKKLNDMLDELMLDLHAIQDYYNDDMQDSYVGFAKEDNESMEVAIDTIRKYKKIRERIKSEMAFNNPNMDVKNLPGLARALEIFTEIDREM